MAISKPAARKLTTQSEWTLLEASYPSRVRELTPARLRQKITRARKLQDKYRDLARQQRGEARGKRRVKGTSPAEGNANTRAKQELFSDALSRFEAQLARVEAKAAKAGAAGKRKGEAKGMARATGKGNADDKAKGSAKGSAIAKETARRKAKRIAKRMEKRDARETSEALAVSARSRSARKSAALARTGATTHHGHVGSRGRRKQARRDSR